MRYEQGRLIITIDFQSLEVKALLGVTAFTLTFISGMFLGANLIKSNYPDSKLPIINIQ
jgi:hypothetical protein